VNYGRITHSLLVLASFALPLRALAGDVTQIPIGPNSLAACGGAAITPTQVVSGQFPTALMGAYVMLPIEVPEGTTQLRVKYCYEGGGNTVDLGLWQSRDGQAPWSPAQFRGWGGSSHPDVAVSAQGFSTEAEYLENPKGYVPGLTTRGFLPGPIPAGTWAAELGVGAVSETDANQLADFRVEIEVSSDPGYASDPYLPAPYVETPANASAGWYAGDMHVHAEHSALGDATMTEVFDYAFASLDDGGAGLDFITLSDYVTSSAWGEIGRHQPLYPGKLVIRSAEIITYHGHAMNHGSALYVDHRAGPVHELAPNGDLTLLRVAQPPATMFAAIVDAGGIAQLNHVTTCPSNTAYCRRTCRGCPWDYSSEETQYGDVAAIEVQSGSFFKYDLFTNAAIAFWDAALNAGEHIAAVGSSDSHTAGVAAGGLDAPIGQATTVVYAESLSEQGILDGLRAGHSYVKLFGNDAPDLRLEVIGDEGGTGIMGDAIPDPSATLVASLIGAVPAEKQHFLKLYRNGVLVDSLDVDAPGVHEFRAETPGRYRIQLERDRKTALEPNLLDVIVVLTSPVYVPEPGASLSMIAAASALAVLRARR
jgi:hypothetical protein